MSYIKQQLVDQCRHCAGTGETYEPITWYATPTGEPQYDETWAPCTHCAGTGTEPYIRTQAVSLHQAADDHAAITTQREETPPWITPNF